MATTRSRKPFSGSTHTLTYLSTLTHEMTLYCAASLATDTFTQRVDKYVEITFKLYVTLLTGAKLKAKLDETTTRTWPSNY